MDGPVVVRHTGTSDGPVVVGIDGSPVGHRATASAFEESAPLTTVIPRDEFVQDTADGSLRLVAGWGGGQAEGRPAPAERPVGWRETHPDVAVEREAGRGRPTRALPDVARHRLLVLGSRGYGGSAGMLPDSTSQ